MRVLMIGIILLMASAGAAAQTHFKLAPGFRTGARPVAPCSGADLSVRHVTDDAAMGGHRRTDYAFKNKSAIACTLKGYPRFELLNKSGGLLPKGRGVNSKQLFGDEAPRTPDLVTIEPGKEATFQVYTNDGGAGYMGKPCPMSSKVKITAPGTTRAFTLKDDIRTCQTPKVSAVFVAP